MKAYELKRIKADLASLRHIASKVYAIDLRECNQGISERQIARRDRLILDAAEIARPMGLVVYHQPDPRGGTLWLIDPEDGPQAGMLYMNGVNV